MASVDVRTRSGEAAGSVDLDDAVFGITPNQAVLHQVVTAQLAAARSGTFTGTHPINAVFHGLVQSLESSSSVKA